MSDHVVASADEIENGEQVVTELAGREIAVFRIDGEYYAHLNWCLHQSGPCCEGRITGTTEATYDREALEQTLTYCREGEVLNCPWHGWEYDIETGECLSRQGLSLPSYPVRVEDGAIIVSL